jgi:hypothetical protein
MRNHLAFDFQQKRPAGAAATRWPQAEMRRWHNADKVLAGTANPG